MNVNTGEITRYPEGEKIPEDSVSVPKARKARLVMCGWGEKKRQRYAHLVKNEGYKKHTAFYCVEFNKGEAL